MIVRDELDPVRAHVVPHGPQDVTLVVHPVDGVRLGRAYEVIPSQNKPYASHAGTEAFLRKRKLHCQMRMLSGSIQCELLDTRTLLLHTIVKEQIRSIACGLESVYLINGEQ